MEITKKEYQHSPAEIAKMQSLKLIKADIKKRASEQSLYKDQRKSIHNKKERVYQPGTAASLHAENRYHLHHLYIAYNQMRGHELSRLFGEKTPVYNDDFLNRTIQHYESQVMYPGT